MDWMENVTSGDYQAYYKKMYEGLLYGDPKSRVLRILWTSIYQDYNLSIRKGAERNG